MQFPRPEPNTVLVAIMNEKRDWAILHDQEWYRIPVESAPPMLRTGEAQYLAFYHTAKFKDLKWQVLKYGKISKISEVSRQHLFPNEPLNSMKAHKRYFKIELEKLLELPQPIVSRRGHRIVFVPTTETKFFQAKDFNSLFNTSPLEEILYQKLLECNIPAERQWFEEIAPDKRYLLDFAIFCKDRRINVECDGDKYHDAPVQVHYDKARNNELESLGWAVLRYPTEKILKDMDGLMNNLIRTIDRYGGYQSVTEPEQFIYAGKGKSGQMRLFE